MKFHGYTTILIGALFISGYSQYGIVVNKSLYNNNANVRTAIANYINAVNTVDQKTMWLYTYDFNGSNFTENPQVLRSVLQNHYATDTRKLEGVVFVGDLPWVLTTDNIGNSGPFDTYWMDMDGSYTAWAGATYAIYGSNAQANTIEIWVSRVCSHNLTIIKDKNGNLLSEDAVVTNYFNKVVARMTQPSIVPFNMACFASDDQDLNSPGQDWHNWWLNPSGLGFPADASTTYEWENSTYDSKNIPALWKAELQYGHTIVCSMVHSTWSSHHISSDDFANMNPQSNVPFFLINGCATGRYTLGNCIAGMYAIAQGGLVAVAQTVGLGLGYTNFTNNLAQGMTFGQAILHNTFGTGFYTLLGVGTLKMQPYLSNNPPPGLMAYYPFNGNANDQSGNGFNGTLRGDAVLTSDRFGNANSAYSFDGNAGISANVTSALSLSRFTLCAWIFGGAAGSYLPRIVAVGAPNTSANYYGLLYANGQYAHAPEVSQRLIFFAGDPANPYSYQLQFSNNASPANSWHHCAATYNGSVIRFYIDGVLDKEIPSSTPITQYSGQAILQIGYSEGPDRYNGKIDEVRVYNRALSGAEINSIK